MHLKIHGRPNLFNERTENLSLIKRYLLYPFLYGFYGFSSFFTTLLIAKTIGYLWGSINNFYIETDDIYLSLIGYVLVFLIRFLENFKEEE